VLSNNNNAYLPSYNPCFLPYWLPISSGPSNRLGHVEVTNSIIVISPQIFSVWPTRSTCDEDKRQDSQGAASVWQRRLQRSYLVSIWELLVSILDSAVFSETKDCKFMYALRALIG